jgi:hypothetical protein
MQLLEGTRVLGFTNVPVGPFCYYQLARLGPMSSRSKSPDPEILRGSWALLRH